MMQTEEIVQTNTKKRIVFSSIFDLTRVYYYVSRGLIDAGMDVYWITTDNLWTEWLRERGVKREDILQLIYDKSDFIDDTAKEALTTEIVKSEELADLTVNQALMMDQFIRRKNKPDIIEYAYLYYRDIKNFFKEKQITHFFCEPTNSNEIISYILCRDLGIKFVVPRFLRYPENRLFFINSYRDHRFYLRHDQPEESISGHELIKRFEEIRPAPSYSEKRRRQDVIDYRRLGQAIVNRLTHKKILSQKNLTHHDLGGRIKIQINGIVNAFCMKYLPKYDRLEDIPGRLAYFPMHVQPESSIDVMGSYFSDQLKLIKDIRRALPIDTTLIIKEHPNFLDMHNYNFFKKVKSLPGVKLIKYDVSPYDILRRSDIVFTVSGTTAYQAGLLGIPAITFCPMFFGGLSSVHCCTNIIALRPLVYELLSNFKRDYQADCRFMEKLMRNSYAALWDNPKRSPQVLDENNLKKLHKAFINVINAEGGVAAPEASPAQKVPVEQC